MPLERDTHRTSLLLCAKYNSAHLDKQSQQHKVCGEPDSSVVRASDMVHGCMVYTELAPRRQQFHVAPAMAAL